MVQKTYTFATPVGNPGGIFDLADYISVSRNNAEADGVMKYGLGVFAGNYDTTATAVKNEGKTVSLADGHVSVFEGVVMNTGTAEMDKYGNVTIPNKVTLGVMTRGRVWVRLYPTAVPAYGATVYVVTAGNNIGTFCTKDTVAADGDDAFTCVAINGKFITSGHDGVEAIDFFGGCAIAEAFASQATNAISGLKLNSLTDVNVENPTNGQVLKYDGSGWANGADATN